MKKLIFAIICLFNALILYAIPSYASEFKLVFRHSGALNTNENLDRVRAQIKLKNEPWTDALSDVVAKSKPAGPAIISLDSRNKTEAALSEADAVNAYANALAWRLTGNKIYFRQARKILSNLTRFQGFTSGTDQDKLLAGWIGVMYGEAAEILRSSPDFSNKDIIALQTMFRRTFYPHLLTPSSWNGNVDLTQINALLTLAVFNEDEAAFKQGLERLDARLPAYIYISGEKINPIIGDGGNTENFWFRPINWVDGLTQETCRDNGHHSQFGLASAINSAEIAWNQGIDVYKNHQARYVSAMELLAKQLLTGDMHGVCQNSKASENLFNTFEVGFNHYHNRLGLSLPYTEKLVKQKIRINSHSVLNIFHETLTHGQK